MNFNEWKLINIRVRSCLQKAEKFSFRGITSRGLNEDWTWFSFPYRDRREVAAGVKSECVRKGDRAGKLAKTVRKLLAERDGGMKRGVLTRAQICARGILTMGRSANFDPPRYSIRPATRSRIFRATTPENTGPNCDFDRPGRAMDDYVIGLHGRSVLGYSYTIEVYARSKGTWWREVKRRYHCDLRENERSTNGCFLKKGFAKESVRKLESNRILAIYFTFCVKLNIARIGQKKKITI